MYRQLEKLVKQQYLFQVPSQYGELRSTNGWDRLASLGHPRKFQRVWHVGFVTAATSLMGGQPNFTYDLWPSAGLVHYICTFSGALTPWRNFDARKNYFASKSCVLPYWQHYTPFTRYNRLSNRLYSRFDNWLYRVNKHPTGCQTGHRLDVCLHDTAGCQTVLTTGMTTVLNEQPAVRSAGCQTGLTTGCIHDTAVCQTGCQDYRLNVCIHDTTGCQTGLTTGLTTGCIV